MSDQPFLKGSSISTLLPFQSAPVRGPSVRSEVNNLRQQVSAQAASSQEIKKDVRDIKSGYATAQKKMLDQEKKIVQQGQTIAELEKKVNDLNQKFVDMAAELQKLKGVSETGESTSSHAHRHKDKICEKTAVDADTGRSVKNKALKRKNGGSYESRVKRSRN